MKNKDKRSILLALILGDGCLHNSSPSQKNKMGYISIKHGIKQADYLNWKARLLNYATNRIVNIHNTNSYVKALDKNYPQVKVQIGMKRMRAWRKFCYPNNKKSLNRILPFIHHKELALALWFMDDGTVGTARANRKDPTRVCSGLVLYLGDIFREDAFAAKIWFENNFDVKPKLKWQKFKYKNSTRTYPELRFTVQDALKIWYIISPIVNNIESMKYKFRLLDERSKRSDLLQPQTQGLTPCEDIVQRIIEQNQ